MQDPRLSKMAQVIVHYSLAIKPDDFVWMHSELGGLALLEEIYIELIKAGAHVHTTLQPTGWDEIFFRHASDEQIEKRNPFSLFAVEQCNKRIRVIANSNTRSLSHVECGF